MPRLQIKIQSVARESGEPWQDAMPMVSLVREAITRGSAPLAAVVLRTDRIDIVDLKNIRSAGMSVQSFLAGLSRSTADDGGEVEAIGIIGVLQTRRAQASEDRAVPMAIAFMEWEDCRWWSWRGLLDVEQKEVLSTSEVVACAEEGDPLPGRFGRWWSLGRRRKMKLHLSRERPSTEEAGAELLN
ncbi:MAG: hypothetical protein GWP91_12180 [Rhodobacterales bacterium]|nr:hypothetical protein [Rhodobacterales bacterium]